MATILKRFTVFTSPAARGKDPIVHSASVADMSRTFCGMDTSKMQRESSEKYYQLPPFHTSCNRCVLGMRKVWPERGMFYKKER